MKKAVSASLIAIALAIAASASTAQTDSSAHPHVNSADVVFVQGMMQHHGQAIVMSSLVPSHTTRSGIRTAARRIFVSQQDEISMMRRWLERRGQKIPAVDMNLRSAIADPMAGMTAEEMDTTAHQSLMPGMLTPKQLRQLAGARGATFDSLFLTFMIHHHEGALTMVERLFATPGAGEESELSQLASDIDADQRAEIARMESMLKSKHLPKKRARS